MLLGSVEESGDQHAHLTIWTFFPFMLFFAISVRVNNPWPNAMFFSNFQMSCIATYSFESQSSPVQLITLKATYLPNILRMRVNLLLT